MHRLQTNLPRECGLISLFNSYWAFSFCHFSKTAPYINSNNRKTQRGRLCGGETPYLECFHMTLRWPYWCPKAMKRRPCWYPKPILWELNSFLMQTLSFLPINLHRCWPSEWKHSIRSLCMILILPVEEIYKCFSHAIYSFYWKKGLSLSHDSKL